MPQTNETHKKAVEYVREKLDSLNIFNGRVENSNTQGVDLEAKSGKDLFYIIVIGGKKQNAKSIYAAVNANSWGLLALKENVRKTFFIAAIIKDDNSNYELHCYTPTEMWARTTKPHVHLKCNPLNTKKGELHSIEETLIGNIPEARYQGENNMIRSITNLPSVLKQLYAING